MTDETFERRELLRLVTLFGLPAVGGCVEINVGGDDDPRSTSIERGRDPGAVDDVVEVTPTPTTTRGDGIQTIADGTDNDIEIATRTDDGGVWRGTETTSAPDVSVLDYSHPSPRVVATDSERTSGDRYDFHVTIENTGIAGGFGITLVYMDDPDDSVYAIGNKSVRSIRRFFSDGERRTVTVTAEWDENYTAFGFRLWAAEVHADVRNDGPESDIEIKLLSSETMNDSHILVDDTIVRMNQGETRTVVFEGNYDNFLYEDLYVEATPVT